jgi:hypothetical protein
MKSASWRRALAAAELITIGALYSSLILPHSPGIVSIATAGWTPPKKKLMPVDFLQKQAEQEVVALSRRS